MPELLPSKKKLVVGLTVGALLVGAAGYYNFVYKKSADTGAAGHAGHQMGMSAVTGEVVKLDAKGRQLAGLQTAQAVKQALTKEIKTTGIIALNDSGRSYITSRVEGRVDELYINTQGETIAPGQAIASVYSPTFIAAQEEYLLALDTVQKLRGASRDVVQINNHLLQAARRKLDLLGVSPDQIAHLEHTRQPNDHMLIEAQFGGTVMERILLPGAYIMPGDKLFALSDLSTVWMYADVYEKDIAGVQAGQEVAVTANAYPGETFSGRITFINPVLDDTTRTVKVRVEMVNPDGKLKPNMYVNAAIQVPLGESLVIPSSSLLDTGLRKVVFVAQDEDTFVKRDIVTGQEVDGYIQVLSGLQPGETVVTAATFLVDSQTQLGQFGSHAGHGGHGASPSGSGAPQTQMPPSMPMAPAAAGEDHSGHGDHSGHTGH